MKRWQQIALVAFAYFGLAWLGLQVSTVADEVTLLWAPAGIALAAVLILGDRVAPGITLGLLGLSASIGSPPLFGVIAAAGNTLAAVAAARLVRRASGSDGRLRTPRDAFVFVACGVFAGAGLSATVGATAMVGTGIVSGADWVFTWAEWWIGDAMGILVVAPPLLAWSSRPVWRGRAESLEALAVAGAIAGVGWLVFRQEPGSTSYPVAFTLLPLTIWAAYRFETFGATLCTLLVTGIAVGGTLAGSGPFARESLSDSVRLMWGFVGSVAATGLALGSLMAVRSRAEAALRESRDALQHEILERERIEEGLRRSERLSSLGTFAAGIAHEINNPLAAILLAAHTARDDVGDPEQLRLALDDIIDETERSARIVRSVLHFSKAEATEFQTLDVREPVARACAHTRKLAVARDMRIELEQPDEPLTAPGNVVELEQVFANLISNAIEASSSRGCVEVWTRREHGSIHVIFRDHGRGMTDAQLARVLEPFYTTRGQEGGTGLGLSLCHGIVTAHGGTLRFDTRVGKGTTVVVELPASRSPDGTHPGR